MSYHNITTSATQSTPNAQGQTAPAGFHYMPDGSLMADADHKGLSANNIITGFDIDFGDIKEAGETRRFSVSGSNGAKFSLEITNEDSPKKYYNFKTNLFQTTQTRLDNVSISKGLYSGSIVFPTTATTDTVNGAVTSGVNVIMDTAVASTMKVGDKVTGNALLDAGNITVAALDVGSNVYTFALSEAIAIADGETLSFANADKYDFLLFTGENTQHINYNEVRFADDSIDINSSTGSNSNAIQKVIYQTLDIDVTINGFAGSSVISSYSNPSQTITTSRGKGVATIPLSITVSVAAGALTIDRQPVDNDIMASIDSYTIGANPVNIRDENIYPVVSTPADDTIDGGTTVNNASSGTTVTTHVNSDTIATLHDRVLGNDALAAKIVTVTAVSSGGKTFTISEAISIADDLPLSFSNQRNYRWPISNTHLLTEGMRVKASSENGFTDEVTIADYLDETIVFENEAREQRFENVKAPAIDTLNVKPTLTRNATTNVVATTQTGNIIFTEQALKTLAGETIKIFGYGTDEINRITGYDVEFTDLKAELNTVTTTTTAAVNPANVVIPVTSTLGIVDKTTQTVNGAITASRYVVLDSVTGLGIGQSLYVGTGLVGTPTITAINETTKTITLSSNQTFADGITLTFPNSIISGVGIDSSVVNPYVNTITDLNLTASVAQALEDEQTLTFTGAGNIVTITGFVKINKVGDGDVGLRFDIDKFLTKH